MKGNPLEGGYKGFFMEESLRKAEETSSSSRSIDQLKKGAEGVQRARGFAPFKPSGISKKNPLRRSEDRRRGLRGRSESPLETQNHQSTKEKSRRRCPHEDHLKG